MSLQIKRINKEHIPFYAAGSRCGMNVEVGENKRWREKEMKLELETGNDVE